MEALVLRLRRRSRKGDGPELRAWGDAALPRWGKGRCWVRGRRCLPRWGKGASELARLILAGLRGKVRCGRSAFQEGPAGAPGGTGGTQSARDGNTRITDENALFPDRTFRFIRLRRSPSCSPSRDRHIPPPSRGENGGLCPHPPKGPVPWVSLFGEPAHISPSPRLPKRRRRQVPARGLAAVCTLTAPPETQRSIHAPCSWGMDASPPSRRRWPPALPALVEFGALEHVAAEEERQ